MRISDWSSDVCSSDLPDARLVSGRLIFAIDAMVKIRTLCHRYRMYRFLCFILLVSTCDVQGASFSEPGFTASARALDGDTIAADFRLLGVDAFERRQLCERAQSCWACGKAAQDHAARLLGEADAQLRLTHRSSYGRPVATVTVKGRDPGETQTGSAAWR